MPYLKETLSRTDCPYSFSCLEKGCCGDENMCKVEYADGTDVLFLKSDRHKVCSHRLYFGDKQVCDCPTHFSIYQLYLRH